MAHHQHHHRTSGGRKPAKKLNVKLLVGLLLIPALVLIVGVAVAVFLRGGEGLQGLTRRRDPEYLIEKGDALMADEQHRLAIRQYEAAAHFDASNAKAVLRIVSALEKMEAENAEEATRNTTRIIGLLHRVTEMDPMNEFAQEKLLAMLYDGVLTLGRDELINQLLELSDKFYSNHPERAYALKYKALAQSELVKRRDLGDLERLNARSDLERALRAFPDDPALLGGLSMWHVLEAARLREAGNEEAGGKAAQESERILRDALTASPDDLEAKLQLARTLFAHKNEAEGMVVLTELEQLLLQRPQPKLSTQVANFLVAADTEPAATRDGELATAGLIRADRVLQVAVDANPADLEAVLSLSAVKKRLGQQVQAVDLLKRAVATQPGQVVGVGAMAERQLRFAAITELVNSYLVMAERERSAETRNEYIREAQTLIDRIGDEMRSTALVDLLEGKIALLQGNIPRAIGKFETADRKFDGRNPEPVFLSAIALQRSGEVGAAIQRLERLAQGRLSGEIELRTNRELARLYMQAGNLDRAERTIDLVLENATEDETARLIKSEILARKSRATPPRGEQAPTIEDAVRLLQPMADAGDVRARIQLARLYRGNEQLEEARRVLEAGLLSDPDNLVLLQQAVQLDVQMEDRGMALKRIDAAIERVPDNRLLPLLRQQVQGGEQTVDMLEGMLKGLEDPFQSALGLYSLYKNTDRPQEAKAQLQRAAELNPDNPKLLEAQLQEALAAQNWDEAQAVCDRAAKLNLDEARGAFWQGRLEMARQQYVRAASSFQAGVRARPLFSNGWRLLGDSHRLSGSLNEAENAFQEAIRLKPDNLLAIYNLFLVYDARDMGPSAMSTLERARQVAPDDPAIQNAYLTYLGRRAPEEALKLRLTKMNEAPDDWRNQLEVARLYAQVERQDDAWRILSSLLAVHPDNLQIVAAAADNRRAADDIEGGRDILENYLERRGEAATIQDVLVVARFLASSGLSEPAVGVYERAIELEDPVEHEATRELADWYFNNQFFARALPLYEKAFAARSDSPRLTLRYVETLIYNGNTELAGHLLSRHVSEQGENPQTALLQCIIAIENKDFDRAARYAESAVQLGPNNPQAYLYRARLNFLRAARGDSRRHVIRDLEKSLSLDPTLLAAREMLVDCYLSETPPQTNRAIEQLELMVRQNPNAPQIRVRLAEMLLNADRVEDAMKRIDEGVALLPEFPAWYALRAHARQKQDRQAEALEDLQTLFKLARNSQNLIRLANGYIAAQKPAEAIELLEGFSEDVGKEPFLMAIKGKALAAAGEGKMARATFSLAFRRAAQDPMQLQSMLQQSPSFIPEDTLVSVLDEIAPLDKTGLAQMTAGQTLLRQGRTADGIRRLESVRAQMPRTNSNFPRLLHLLATSYQEMRDYPSAAGVYRQLLTVVPDDFIVYNNLAFLLCENLGQPQEAIELANKALQLAPEEQSVKSNVLDTLGWAYFKAGDLNQAQLSLAESVRYEQGLHNQLHLSQVLIAKDMQREARLQLRSLRRTAQSMENAEFVRRAEELLQSL